MDATLSAMYYRSRKDPLVALRQRMREVAETRVRFGYRRLRVLLQREGWEVGRKRFYRVYMEEGLAAVHRGSRPDTRGTLPQGGATAENG